MYPPHRLLVLHCSQYQHNVLPQHPFYTHFARMSPHHHDNRTDTGCAYWLNHNLLYVPHDSIRYRRMYTPPLRLQRTYRPHNWFCSRFRMMPQHHRGNLQGTGCVYWLSRNSPYAHPCNTQFQQMYMLHSQLRHKSRPHNWSYKHLYLLPLYHRDN